jgi:glyceraldehyde 3-phosphate dehydrogenase
MIRIGLNGFGRIGRAIFRNSMFFEDIQIVAINDINPEIENLKYLLKYDSFYGRFDREIKIDGNNILIGSKKIRVYQENNISDVLWNDNKCDIVIEAAGVHSLLDELPKIINSGVKKVLVTYSPKDKVDKHIVLGGNEEIYDADKDNIISSSICDVVALAPVYKIINDNFSISNGFLTTLHPWLAYQNVLDGPPESWGYPGSLYGHYSLGRASTASLIIKPTTAMTAADKIFPGIINTMKCYSYRVPTPVVGAADITFQIEKSTSKEELIEIFKSKINDQKWPILFLNEDPLVSVDFRGTDYSAIIDLRWCEVLNGNLIKITLWYDNEYGYSRRVVDLARFLFDLEPRLNVNEKNSLS